MENDVAHSFFSRFDFFSSFFLLLLILCVLLGEWEKDVYSRDTQHSTVLLFFLSFLVCPVSVLLLLLCTTITTFALSGFNCLDLCRCLRVCMRGSECVCVCCFAWLKYEAYSLNVISGRWFNENSHKPKKNNWISIQIFNNSFHNAFAHRFYFTVARKKTRCIGKFSVWQRFHGNGTCLTEVRRICTVSPSHCPFSEPWLRLSLILAACCLHRIGCFNTQH